MKNTASVEPKIHVNFSVVNHVLLKARPLIIIVQMNPEETNFESYH